MRAPSAVCNAVCGPYFSNVFAGRRPSRNIYEANCVSHSRYPIAHVLTLHTRRSNVALGPVSRSLLAVLQVPCGSMESDISGQPQQRKQRHFEQP